MLVLTRKTDEQILIGDNIKITLVRVRGNSVRIGIEAPRDVRIVRGELESRGKQVGRCRRVCFERPRGRVRPPRRERDEPPRRHPPESLVDGQTEPRRPPRSSSTAADLRWPRSMCGRSGKVAACTVGRFCFGELAVIVRSRSGPVGRSVSSVGRGQPVLTLGNAVVGINLVQMLEKDSTHLKNRLARHVDRRVVGIDDQLALHVVHRGAFVINDAVTATRSAGDQGRILEDADDVVILDVR